jgi:maltose phosphorylase
MRTAYDFYEPMTLHFSSLSYNTHAIIATKIGRDAQAYDYFMKAAGLDLDDLRGATRDGLHAAALAGTWQTVAYGFLGMHLKDDALVFEPRLPEDWKSIRLKITYRGYLLDMTVTHDKHTLKVDTTTGREPARVVLNGESYALSARHTAESSQGVLN